MTLCHDTFMRKVINTSVYFVARTGIILWKPWGKDSALGRGGEDEIFLSAASIHLTNI